MYAASYVWAKILMQLEQQLSEITVSAWLDDTEVIDLTEDTLTVYSPSDFRQQIIRDRCAPYILQALGEILQCTPKLQVWGDQELRAHRQEQKEQPACFNPRFTFDSFVSGQSNQLAAKVAKAAAEQPGQELYNPLFLYGPPGVGKTHLLYAMVNRVLERFPDKQVVYIRADQFTNELIHSIRNSRTDEFKRKYRKADLLLVDDIQFIAGKEATQEEFFHTFNDLFQRGKQIVMTADRRPADMVTLEDRLKSRFGAGIMIGIAPPDYDTRYAITRQKARDYKLDISDQVAAYIADALANNVRQIEGALKKLRAVHELTGTPLKPETVKRLLEDLCSGDSAHPVTPELILRNVCKYYGVDEEVLKGPHRSKKITEPRQVAMYLVRSLLGMGFEDLGKLFRRDHGTVHYSVKKVEESLKMKNTHLEGILRDITTNIENTPY